MTKIKLLKVGADVEGFLITSQGLPTVCIGLLKGTKEQPHKIDLGEPGFAYQEDNVLPEYNIPPADNAEKFAKNIDTMRNYLVAYFKGNFRLRYSTQASMYFELEKLDHPQAKKFGCEPDFCVWTRSTNEMPTKVDPRLRTSGGHLHVSYKIGSCEKAEDHPEYMEIMENLIKTQDLLLGIPSLFMETDKIRRQLYGKAGAFRPKSYGHEYRVLSPFWATGTAMAEWAFNQTSRAVDMVNDGFTINPTLGKSIQKAINESNLKIAENLCRNYSLSLV